MAHKIFAENVKAESVQVVINGKKQWRWVITSFEGDTYENGEDVIVNESAKTEKGLFVEPEAESDYEYLKQDLYEGIEDDTDLYANCDW